MLLPLVKSYFQGEAVKEATKAESEAQARALAEARLASEEGMGYIRPYEQIGYQSLKDLTGGLESGAYETDVGDFQYGKTLGDFLDPSMQFQQENAQRAMEQSALAGGGLASGSTLKALQEQAMGFAQQDYGNSFNRMQTDKNFAYGQFSDKFNRLRGENQDRYSRLAALSNLGANSANNMANIRQGEGAQAINIMGQQGQTNANRASANPMMYGNMVQGVQDSSDALMGSLMMGGGGGMPQQPQQQNFSPNSYGLATGGPSPSMPQQGQYNAFAPNGMQGSGYNTNMFGGR